MPDDTKQPARTFTLVPTTPALCPNQKHTAVVQQGALRETLRNGAAPTAIMSSLRPFKLPAGVVVVAGGRPALATEPVRAVTSGTTLTGTTLTGTTLAGTTFTADKGRGVGRPGDVAIALPTGNEAAAAGGPGAPLLAARPGPSCPSRALDGDGRLSYAAGGSADARPLTRLPYDRIPIPQRHHHHHTPS
jgi:hypothetical protein